MYKHIYIYIIYIYIYHIYIQPYIYIHIYRYTSYIYIYICIYIYIIYIYIYIPSIYIYIQYNIHIYTYKYISESQIKWLVLTPFLCFEKTPAPLCGKFAVKASAKAWPQGIYWSKQKQSIYGLIVCIYVNTYIYTHIQYIYTSIVYLEPFIYITRKRSRGWYTHYK